MGALPVFLGWPVAVSSRDCRWGGLVPAGLLVPGHLPSNASTTADDASSTLRLHAIAESTLVAFDDWLTNSNLHGFASATCFDRPVTVQCRSPARGSYGDKVACFRSARSRAEAPIVGRPAGECNPQWHANLASRRPAKTWREMRLRARPYRVRGYRAGGRGPRAGLGDRPPQGSICPSIPSSAAPRTPGNPGRPPWDPES